MAPRLRKLTSELSRAAVIPFLAVVTALAVGAVIILLSGKNPILSYWGLLLGAFGSPNAISETFVWATPYMFAGLAVALGFKCGLFNIGVEGQIAIGALCSAFIGYSITGLPAIIHLPLAIGCGVLGGFVWGAIPGLLKARTGAHEVINTIMMNYIALFLSNYLLSGPMKDPDPMNAVSQTPKIALSARLPRLFPPFYLGDELVELRVHWGTVLAIVMAIVVFWFLWKTVMGFEIRTVGANPNVARYAGINVSRSIVLAMALSGALAGLAGTVEVVGLNYYHTPSFAVGYGFDSIAIALLGKSHPFGIIPAAILFGAMRNGATAMQFQTGVSIDVISIIQALILIFIAADAIIRRLYRIRARGAEEQVTLTRGWGS
jgi:general nucleoside transport system permease protein